MSTSTIRALYAHSLSLLTDLYQLTMACGMWQQGLAEREAVFHLSFRHAPFGGGYAIAAGLQTALEYLDAFRFNADDLAYLGGLCGADARPLFDPGFLAFLRDTPLRCTLDAVPEGTAVFAFEPLLRVQGPLYQCLLLETPLLNTLNFQTLIATKACRVCLAAEGEPVLEFGLRRAQGIDGALAASRAAYIGGCSATSNVLAGKLHGIPVRGTHAHSWVMAFEDERRAFEAYAEAMPGNCVFLVDTYDTLEGVRRAVEVGRQLQKDGHALLGVRLDSGDLAELSIASRRILDEAGFSQARVVASNDLDEELILSLKRQGARIDTWGVGTKLITAFDQPALGGVYKLAALRDAQGAWQPRIKLSEQAIKVSTPGRQQIRRYRDAQGFAADIIHDLDGAEPRAGVLADPTAADRQLLPPANASWEDLLQPAWRPDQARAATPSLESLQARVRAQLAHLPAGVTRFANPARYPVGIEQELHALKQRLVAEARGRQNAATAAKDAP